MLILSKTISKVKQKRRGKVKELEILSLFSGIGAFEKALYNINIDYKLIGFSEIDKYAIKSYCAIHDLDEKLNLGDITKIDIDKLPRFIDIITHGSPCQDFSIAGKQIGGDVGTNTRSSLMWNTVEIVKWCLPKYVIWENVRNILSPKHIHNFNKYIETLKELGYNNYYQILNAKDYGIPQNRERVYTISIRKDIDKGTFKFPEKEELHFRLKDVLEAEVDEKYYLSERMVNGFIRHNEKHKQKGTGFIWKAKNEKDIANTLRANASLCPTDNTIKVIGNLDIKGQDNIKRVYASEGISPTLTNMQGGNRQPKIEVIGQASNEGSQAGKVYSDKGLSPSLCAGTHGYSMGNIQTNTRIRRLTPKECWKLMGFSNKDFEKAANIPTSDTQLYKQAGNSIVVPVLEKIFINLFKEV